MVVKIRELWVEGNEGANSGKGGGGGGTNGKIRVIAYDHNR